MNRREMFIAFSLPYFTPTKAAGRKNGALYQFGARPVEIMIGADYLISGEIIDGQPEIGVNSVYPKLACANFFYHGSASIAGLTFGSPDVARSAAVRPDLRPPAPSRKKSPISALGPAIGIIHDNSQNPIPLVYDLMEPLRPLVDQNFLELALSNPLTPGDFTISKWGGCRLNPQMAKVVAGRLAAIGVVRVVTEFLRQVGGQACVIVRDAPGVDLFSVHCV